ncbi:MAG: hypothetical protein M0P69_09110 [Bacteroidales bacterium]|jgi:hypothetical protein|nr:hypothetical protein [Bacteroidales bacterium]MDD2569662.1 hypothetical protein [Bacteroidales bacterium]MDD2813068.1 hypothetical protein [Bacteroidales bacterium]MDD3384773.1 hypothetical protein [Bacteroidales bacterium]MDD3810868.1 hypothetical protein [Bacteroidales bacterium]
MIRTGLVIISVVFFVLFFSCKPDHQKRAEADFLKVEQFARNSQPKSAIRLLDSMQVQYASDYGVVGKVLKMKSIIGNRFYQEMIEAANSTMEVLDREIATLEGNFRYTPGEAGRPGVYEHRRQSPQNSWNRTYLKINLNDKGDVWLSSHYYGKEWIDHTSIRVYDRDLYVLSDTIPLGDVWNRKVEDLGDRWEIIEFREGTDAGIMAFIADHYERPLKARFNGRKFHYIVMETFDREAIHYGWRLAQLLKERESLRQTIDLYQRELIKVGPLSEGVDSVNSN